MSSILETLFMIISAVELIVGILGNGFIVLVNSIDWIRNRKVSLIDCILTCLAISRICLLWVIILNSRLNVCEILFYCRNTVALIFQDLWLGSNYFSTVCNTCLNVFYFLRIANFSNPIFLWMKWRIHRVLLIIVLGPTFCLFTCFLLNETLLIKLWEDQVNMEENTTCIFVRNMYAFMTSQSLLGMAFIFLFLVSLASFLLLILSLCNHTRQMKLQGTRSRGPSTEAHIRAIRAMISFLLLFVVYYLSSSLMVLTHGITHSVMAKMSANVLMFFYPSFHSLLLILWNNKLKEASFCVLRKLKCAWNQGNPHSHKIP
ncbi:taste receptor type 2 member 8-like [Choloepus didactylus]|uniref:taste receptor type 2 member 8-like n=1 Tax=Choloepus didactylus TaxID=27675 RepID=UPI00189F14E7|nr:taste receptor type 2 member 8-like [Choloepus didactylus]